MARLGLLEHNWHCLLNRMQQLDTQPDQQLGARALGTRCNLILLLPAYVLMLSLQIVQMQFLLLLYDLCFGDLSCH